MLLTDEQKAALVAALENGRAHWVYGLPCFACYKYDEEWVRLTPAGRLLAEALRELEQCREVLRDVEWGSGYMAACCPWCQNSDHAHDCKLAKALSP